MEGIEHNEIGLPGLQDSGHGVEEVVEVDRSHHGAGAGHLGRWVFSSPVSGAERNTSIQASWVVGTQTGGIWTSARVQGSRVASPKSPHLKAPALTLLGPVPSRSLHPEL